MTTRQSDPYIGCAIAFGQFAIVRKIGAGGMGSVYAAEQRGADRIVAVKLIRPDLADRGDVAKRFRREARALTLLTHPNTVRVLSHGQMPDGTLFIVMEHLAGETVHAELRRRGPLRPGRAVPIVVQVSGALDEAHARGIVHRDLKPENVLLTTSRGVADFPKLLDFGLAKVGPRELRTESIALTMPGSVFGTAPFMSPEQARGAPLDGRSDVYSLAVTMYEMLTGRLPFDADSPAAFLHCHQVTPPIPIDRRVPGLTFSPGLVAAVQKALEKNPAQRFGSAGAFGRALQPFAEAPATSLVDAPTEEDTAAADAIQVLWAADATAADLETLRRSPPVALSAIAPSRRGLARTVVVRGLLAFDLDVAAMLRALVMLAEPLASAPAVADALTIARETAHAPGVARPMIRAVADKLLRAVGSADAALAVEIAARAERAAVEQRAYERRTISGESRVRCMLEGAGVARAVPTYVPEAAAAHLPLFRRAPVRLLVGAHAADEEQDAPLVLDALVVGRVLDTRAVG